MLVDEGAAATGSRQQQTDMILVMRFRRAGTTLTLLVAFVIITSSSTAAYAGLGVGWDVEGNAESTQFKPWFLFFPLMAALLGIFYAIQNNKQDDESNHALSGLNASSVVKPRLDIADRKPSSLQAMSEADGVMVTWMKPPALEPNRIEETWIAVFEDNEEVSIFGVSVEPKGHTEYFINASHLTIGQVYRVELTYFLEAGWGVDDGYGEPSITTFAWP